MLRARTATSPSSIGAAIWRWVLLILLWSALVAPSAHGSPSGADFLAGACAAALAAWVSLRLLPPCLGASLPGSLRLAIRLLGQSAGAGLDIAARAFKPALPLHPGQVPFRTEIARGTARDAFAAITSLVPGTLPVGEDEDGRIIYHCLDVEQSVTDQLRDDESAVRRALHGASAPSAARLASGSSHSGHASRRSRRPPSDGAGDR